MSTAKVALVALGCRVNRAEVESLGRSLASEGIRLAPADEADVIVVNTCCVTAEATAKTRKALRRAARGGPRALIAYGCAARLFADELAAIAPVTVVRGREAVAEAVREAIGEPVREGTSPGDYALGRARPSIKVQDGCDRRCRFCVVWRARGRSRSIAADQVVAEVARASEAGHGEVVLCGVNLGLYRDRATDLAGLLRRILAETPVGRVRLSSLEPEGLTDALLEAMAESGERIAPYLHLPLQSGSAETLAAMGRAMGPSQFAERVRRARALMPQVAIGCDLICGYPGETERLWRESLAFCEEMAFAKMHVFRFSPRPGTVAARLPDPVDPALAHERSREALALGAAMREAFVRGLVGTEQLVAVEEAGAGVTGGLVRALVDRDAPKGSLVRARVGGLAGPDVVDCR